MLIKLLKYNGMNKGEILEFLRNPDEEIKELLFELDHGPKTKKFYCPECKELMFPKSVVKEYKRKQKIVLTKVIYNMW
jgi:hypothetical protein